MTGFARHSRCPVRSTQPGPSAASGQTQGPDGSSGPCTSDGLPRRAESWVGGGAGQGPALIWIVHDPVPASVNAQALPVGANHRSGAAAGARFQPCWGIAVFQ